jgi:hypothetical protein
MIRRSVMGTENSRHRIRLAALFLIFFSPVLAYLAILVNGGNTLLFEDGLFQSFPFRAFLRSAFANGFSPQWVPFSACGFSLLAEGQNGICFPSTQIIYRIFSAEVGWIVELISARLLAFALCAFFLRRSGISRVSSLFGASVYAFSAATFGFEGVPAIMWSFSLLPGIFLSCDHFIKGNHFSFLHMTTVLALLLLTGHPVMIIYIGLMIVAFFIFHLLKGRGEGALNERGTTPRLLSLLGCALVAALIASPQLLPMLEEFRFSARTVGPGISLTDLQNTLYLSPGWIPLSLFPIQPHWGEWAFWSNAIRFPLYALFLFLIGMLFGVKGTHRSFFIFLCFFSILMALGPYVGLWKLVHSLPVLRYFRFPYRWLFFLPICVAFFSAHGMDHLVNLPNAACTPGRGKAVKFLLVTGFATTCIYWVRHYSELSQNTGKAIETSPWIASLLLVCAIGMTVAAFLSLGQVASKRGLALGAAATVLSLFAALVFNIQDPLAIRDLREIGWKGGNVAKQPQTFRTSSAFSPGEIWLMNKMHTGYHYTPNLTVLSGTLSTGHYFSFFPYWSANISAWCQDALKGSTKKRVYLDLTSSRWLFVPEGSRQWTAFPTETYHGTKAYRNPYAIPRANVVSSYRLFSDEGALISFIESPGNFDARQEVAVLRRDAEAWNLQADVGSPGAPVQPAAATVVAERPDRMEIELDPATTKGAFLVLNDTYYPGWKALVDGVETRVVRANYAFRGVNLPAGAKHVVFFFDPLVPDAALPFPTLILATIGVASCLGRCRFLISKRKSNQAVGQDIEVAE